MTLKTPTAALIVIGNEILSGGTQDANIAFIGKRLAARGLRLSEVRIVPDIHDKIAKAVNELRSENDYVFTTGGIGPTHDDITVESVAQAFATPVEINEEARETMTRKYAERGVEMNAGRLRMARAPIGAKLLHCEATIAPGIHIGNVFIMAGVPKIMQAQFDVVDTMIEGGPPVLSRTVQCNLKEGDIAIELEAIQKQFPDIDIGSYPHMGQTPSLSLVLRGTDDERLKPAAELIKEMIRKFGDEPLAA